MRGLLQKPLLPPRHARVPLSLSAIYKGVNERTAVSTGAAAAVAARRVFFFFALRGIFPLSHSRRREREDDFSPPPCPLCGPFVGTGVYVIAAQCWNWTLSVQQ